MFEDLFGSGEKGKNPMEELLGDFLKKVPPGIQLGMLLITKMEHDTTLGDKKDELVEKMMGTMKKAIEKYLLLSCVAPLAIALSLETNQAEKMCETHAEQIIKEMLSMHKIKNMKGDH